jgi:23S rRNA pseudouridine1911/1915/1917 synthase
MRIDKFLSQCIEDTSRGTIQKWIDEKLLLCNGEIITKKTSLREGDTIQYPAEAETEEEGELKPNAIPLNIVYEDDDIIVINKEAGMIVHPGNNTENNTLCHAILAHCGESIREVGDPERPGIVHRLDKETSGLVVIAKTATAHERLQDAFQEREVFKEYECIVEGVPSLQSGTIEEPIGRHPRIRVKMTICPEGREAKTDWKIISSHESYSHIRCRIHTGRTHQIRVHMKFIGHPILGDMVYGFRRKTALSLSAPRVMLHSCQLAFSHPTTGKALEFTAPTPKDFEPWI